MAKKHPTSSNRSQDRKVSEDDKFVAGVLEASGWAQKNEQTLVVIGVVVLVLGALGWWVATNRAQRMDEALVELERATAMVQQGDPEQAKVELAQYLESYGGSPFAGEARLHLATLHLQSDQPGQALAVLDESGIGPREPLGAQILTLRGRAYEAQGQFQQAADTYLRLAETADISFQERSALEDAARMRAEMGDYSGAAELYTRLQEGLEPSDPQSGVYQMREQEMRARARS